MAVDVVKGTFKSLADRLSDYWVVLFEIRRHAGPMTETLNNLLTDIQDDWIILILIIKLIYACIAHLALWSAHVRLMAALSFGGRWWRSCQTSL